MKRFKVVLLILFFTLSLTIAGTTKSVACLNMPSKPQSEPFQVMDITTDEVESLVDNAGLHY